VLLAACGSSGSSATTTTTLQLKPRITITSVSGNVESELVAAIYARALEDAGFRVARKDPVSMDRAAYYAAVQKGDFSLIPDYSGDLLKFVFEQPGAGAAPTTSSPSGPATTQAPVTVPDSTTTVAGATTTTRAATTTAPAATTTTTVAVINNGRSAAEQVVALKAALPSTLTVGNPAAGENKNVIACTAATVKLNTKLKFDTYTDLASVAPHLVLGAPASFMTDPDEGMKAWTNTYGGTFKNTITVEPAGLAASIDKGSADCYVMNSLDPLLTTKKMTLLIDDKAMVRGNAVLALLAKNLVTPDLTTALDRVNIALTTTRLNQMLNEISANHTDPKVVAGAFMDTL
jgi:osmoprotectant transport system substrate-binding protein